jgi:hypothetical protein
MEGPGAQNPSRQAQVPLVLGLGQRSAEVIGRRDTVAHRHEFLQITAQDINDRLVLRPYESDYFPRTGQPDSPPPLRAGWR